MFLRSNLLREVKFFCTVMIYFFLDSCFFPFTKKLLKVSDHSVEEIQHESTTLMSHVHYNVWLSYEALHRDRKIALKPMFKGEVDTN